MLRNKLSLLLLLLLLGALLVPLVYAARQQTGTSPQVSAGPGHDQEVIRQILDLERQSKDAAVHRDPDFSSRTLADDYLAITPLGQVITKADTVAARKSGQLRYDSIEISDMVVRVYGSTAVVTARADVRGRDLGEEFNGPYRFTRVWVRRNGHWQAVTYQATVTR
jgi:hypothetical protein